MQASTRPALAPSEATQSPLDPASQALVDARADDSLLPGAVSAPSQEPSPDHSLPPGTGSVVSLRRGIVVADDPLRRQSWPFVPNSPSPGVNQGFAQYVHYGQSDPSKQSRHQQTAEDRQRKASIAAVNGACGRCRKVKQQCDDLEQCHRCVLKQIPSQSEFLRSLAQSPHTAGLQKVTLFNLDIQAPSGDTPPSSLGSASLRTGRQEADHYLDSWFKRLNWKIGAEGNSANFGGTMSLSIVSGDKPIRTSFEFDFSNIARRLGEDLSPLNERSLLGKFVVHAVGDTSHAFTCTLPDSDCVRHLNWLSVVVSNTFVFLTAFSNADVYGPIMGMGLARASLGVIYASLYRLLLARSHQLTQFLINFSSRGVPYCARRYLKDDIKEALSALARYHRVVTGLAESAPRSDCEVETLLSPIRERARHLLRSGDIRRLLVKIHEKLKPPSQCTFQGLISRYSDEIPEMNSLSIGLRFNPINDRNDAGPLPESMLRSEPRHLYQPTKVQALLKKNNNKGPLSNTSEGYLDTIFLRLFGADEPPPPSTETIADLVPPGRDFQMSDIIAGASPGDSQNNTFCPPSDTEETLPAGGWNSEGFEIGSLDLAKSPTHNPAHDQYSDANQAFLGAGGAAPEASLTCSDTLDASPPCTQKAGTKAVSCLKNDADLGEVLNDEDYAIFLADITNLAEISSEDDPGETVGPADDASRFILRKGSQKRARSDDSQDARRTRSRTKSSLHEK